MTESILGTVSPMSMMRQVLKFAAVCFIVICVLFSDVTYGTNENKKLTPQKRERRGTRNQLRSSNNLTDILEQYNLNHTNTDLLRYTPSTPSPENVNCYVEVPVTRRLGGRCVPLGSQTMGCQAGIYLAFTPDCPSPQTQPRRSSPRRPFPRRRLLNLRRGRSSFASLRGRET